MRLKFAVGERVVVPIRNSVWGTVVEILDATAMYPSANGPLYRVESDLELANYWSHELSKTPSQELIDGQRCAAQSG